MIVIKLYLGFGQGNVFGNRPFMIVPLLGPRGTEGPGAAGLTFNHSP